MAHHVAAHSFPDMCPNLEGCVISMMNYCVIVELLFSLSTVVRKRRRTGVVLRVLFHLGFVVLAPEVRHCGPEGTRK